VQVARVTKMLGDEYGTASNIKSRVNRLSVLSAITSAQQRLKLYNKVRALRGLGLLRQAVGTHARLTLLRWALCSTCGTCGQGRQVCESP